MVVKDTGNGNHRDVIMRAHYEHHGLDVLDAYIGSKFLENPSYMATKTFGSLFQSYFSWCNQNDQVPSGRALLSMVALAYTRFDEYAAKQLKRAV